MENKSTAPTSWYQQMEKALKSEKTWEGAFITESVVHRRLRRLDPTMLTSPDGKRVEVNLDAIIKLVEEA